jgi:GT2 family glycosyltransferase
MTTIRICALLCSFNRKDATLRCLEGVAREREALRARGGELCAVLVDDGSTDGTPELVGERHGWVRVVRTREPLFWCRSMHLAQQQPEAQAATHQWLLNDDVDLRPGVLAALLDTEATLRAQGEGPLVIVGATADAHTGLTSYGGERRGTGWRRSRFQHLTPGAEPMACDAMNGNIVLLPRDARARVGDLDPAFEHAMGDTDFALRARALGVGVWLAPGHWGWCSDNPPTGTYLDPALPWPRRWRHMLSRKGLPWRSWLHFTRRHMGLAWPLYFVWPYLKLLGQIHRWRGMPHG